MDNEILLVIIIASCIAYLVYVIIDTTTEEEEVLQDRLARISEMKEVEPEIKKKKDTNFIDFIISFYFEPILKNKAAAKVGDAKEEKNKNETKTLLMTSGRPFSDDDILKFKATQMFAGVVGAIIGLVLGLILFRINIQMLFLLSIVCGFIGFIFPKIRLRMITKRRYAEIAYNLPDSLDLLVVCVEAGLGLDAALTRVATEQMRTAPVLAREFGRVSKEILAGIPRQEAFRNLAIRNNVDDLKSFVALLVQTDKLGTSIAQSLRVYADTVRTKRRQKAEKLAAEASVKMVIPLVLFILPSMFVVLLGPAILNLIEQFAGG